MINCFQLSSKGHNYLLNNAFKWVLGEQAVTVQQTAQVLTEEPIVYGAYHFVSCLKGFNNSVAYSLKYQIDLLLSAAVLFKIQGKAIFGCTDFARR